MYDNQLITFTNQMSDIIHNFIF